MSIEYSNCWYKEVCDVECSPVCLRFTEMSALIELSNIPVNRQTPQKLIPPEVDYDAFCELADIKDNIKEFVDTGKNLYIASKYTGNGKTTWSIKLMLKYFDEVWAGNGFRVRGLFIHVPTFLLQCKDFKKFDAKLDMIRDNLADVDLVIWDDIASTDLSAYDYSQLLMYIDSRISNCKSNIFTGNIVTRDLLQKAVGDKLTSRIWSSQTEIVEFVGSDKR